MECKFCNNEFENKNKLTKYCSKTCKDKAYYYRNYQQRRNKKNNLQKSRYKSKKENKVKECDFCQKLFSYWHSSTKYCSSECRKKTYYNKLEKEKKYTPISKLNEKEILERRKNAREYYRRDIEKSRTYFREYREKNKIRINNYKKRYYKENPIYSRNSDFIRRTKKNQIKITMSKKTYLELKNKKYCSYCKIKLNKENFTIDHIIPISNKGTNEKINLLSCCRKCNTSKHNHDLIEWSTNKNLELNKEILKRYYILKKQSLTKFLNE